MGLFDTLKGMLGQVEGSAFPAMVNTILAQTQYHDLAGLVAALEKGGLGPQVQSWLGNGKNMPITEDQLKAVLGNAQLQDLARHAGLPVDEAAQAPGAIPAGARRQSEPERGVAAAQVRSGAAIFFKRAELCSISALGAVIFGS